MYLKEIKTVGFKSFASKINISLDKGITGIVGPNGSGKSNIVDAVRFVLGEQSVKSLRGADSMSDVIFSGSKSRAALNYASVTLVFDNSDYHLPIEYTEVSVKRCVYRNLDNEYYLNGEKCRLKDITDLFTDSGMGKSSFNIISQGSVGEIINQKAIDRRVIFEDAAGVLKYRKRKEEATRRLDRTDNNLDRVNDIIVELNRQVEPLREQARLARQYVDVKGKLKEVEVGLITYDITNLNHKSTNINKTIEQLNNDILISESNYGNLYNSLQSLKTSLTINEESYKKKNSKLIELTLETEKLNSDRRLILEQNKLQSNKTIDEEKLASLAEDRLKLKNGVDNVNKEIISIKDSISYNNSNLSKQEQLFNEQKNKKIELDKQISNKLKEEITLKHNIDILRASVENNSKVYSSVKSVLDNPRLKGICNIVANVFETTPKYHTAIQTAIASQLQVVITENESSAKGAIEYLKEYKLGRVTFYPLNVIRGKYIDTNTKELLDSNKVSYSILVDKIEFDSKYDNIMNNLLGNIILVNDIDAANKVSKLINYKYRIVTIDGEVINVGGSITGGVNNKTNNLVSQKYELEEKIRLSYDIEKEIKLLEENLNEVYYAMNKIDDLLSEYKIKQTNSNELLSLKIKHLKELEEQLKDISLNIESLSSIKDNNLDKLENSLLEKYYEGVSKIDNLKLEIEKLVNNKKILTDEIEVVENQIKDSSGLINKYNKSLKENEININKINMKLDNLLNTLNSEYNMTYEGAVKIYSLDIEEDLARSEVTRLKRVIKEIGMVNLNAIEEFDEVNTRYEFLNGQANELIEAKEELLKIINEMDEIMKEKFEESFNKVNEQFGVVFNKLFSGGTAKLELTNKENLLETGIDIIASPPGKKLQHLSLLSGGEKTLTAIALLFAILNTRPVPFCVLDEIEAALDDVNVDNFGQYITDYKDKTQFILITHKKKTMEYADCLYGITMQESGVSKLVSVVLSEIRK